MRSNNDKKTGSETAVSESAVSETAAVTALARESVAVASAATATASMATTVAASVRATGVALEPESRPTGSPAPALSAPFTVISDWIVEQESQASQTVDVSTAMEELLNSYEELRVAEEELLIQNQSLTDMQAILEAERVRYRELFETAPDVYIVTDARGTVREANQAALQMFRIEPRFIVGKPLVSFICTEERPAFRAYFSKTACEPRLSWETRVQPRAGTAIPVDITVASDNYGNGIGMQRWLLRDTTSRRQAEAALFESNQLLHALIQASPVAIAILNDANRVTLWNPAAERITGWRAGEVIGGAPPGIPVEIRSEFDRKGCLVSNSRHGGVETRLVDKAGNLVDTELWTAPILGKGGQTVATVAIATDISDRKRAEQESRRLAQRLVNVQEEERARLSREIHDHLGQHLTAIMLGLKSLQSEHEASPCGERRAAAEKSFQLQNMVEQMMQTTHRLAWELRPPELDDIGLEAAIHRYTTHWAERFGIEIDFQNAGYRKTSLTPEVETTLYRIVQEALTNVARHAEASRASVVLKCDEVEGTVIIEDDGIGFAVPAAGSSCARLGLTGMRERLNLVGGSLEIESQPGDGATVFARVPHEAKV